MFRKEIMKKLVLSFVLFVGLSSSVAMADLSSSCKSFFNKADDLIGMISHSVEAASNDQNADIVKQQIELAKQSIELSKQQISALPAEHQESECEQGITLLEQMEMLIK
jgi:hypothetical protein